MREIRGELVHGRLVDGETRCAHYDSVLDLIAIKFKCCGHWFACFECHKEQADHRELQWTRREFGERAVLCGRCGRQLTIREYMQCEFRCPACSTAFNPGCAKHYDLYFEMAD
jgi:uncharacterized CHY-type Zn-finger protein